MWKCRPTEPPRKEACGACTGPKAQKGTRPRGLRRRWLGCAQAGSERQNGYAQNKLSPQRLEQPFSATINAPKTMPNRTRDLGFPHI